MYSKDIKEKIIRCKKLIFSWNDNANNMLRAQT